MVSDIFMLRICTAKERKREIIIVGWVLRLSCLADGLVLVVGWGVCVCV